MNGAPGTAKGVALGQCQEAVGVLCLVLGSSLLSFLGSVDVSELCMENSGPVPSSGQGPAFPILVAIPAPSSGAFLLWLDVQILRKPLLSLLLPVLLSPALLALLSAPPSARMAAQEGKGL